MRPLSLQPNFTFLFFCLFLILQLPHFNTERDKIKKAADSNRPSRLVHAGSGLRLVTRVGSRPTRVPQWGTATGISIRIENTCGTRPDTRNALRDASMRASLLRAATASETQRSPKENNGDYPYARGRSYGPASRERTGGKWAKWRLIGEQYIPM